MLRRESSLSSLFSLFRGGQEETRAGEERERESEKKRKRIESVFSSLFCFFSSRFLLSNLRFGVLSPLFKRTQDDKPRPLPPRGVDFDFSVVVAELLLQGGAEPESNKERARVAAIFDHIPVVVDIVAAASALPPLPRPPPRLRDAERQREKRISFSPTLGGRLGPQAGLVPALLDSRHGPLRRRRCESRRRRLAGAGRRGRGLRLVVGLSDRVPRGLPRLRARDEEQQREW